MPALHPHMVGESATGEALHFLSFLNNNIPTQPLIPDVSYQGTFCPNRLPSRVGFTAYGLPAARLIETTNFERVGRHFAVIVEVETTWRGHATLNLLPPTSNECFFFNLVAEKFVQQVLSEAQRVASGAASFPGAHLDSLLTNLRDSDAFQEDAEYMAAVDAAIKRTNISQKPDIDKWASNLAGDLVKFDD